VDLLTFIVVLAVGAPIAKALATRIQSGRGGDSGHLRDALEQTEHRLEMTDQQLADTLERLAEVEERLDFAERFLTRQDRDRLGP
jgi:hypothetical protein